MRKARFLIIALILPLVLVCSGIRGSRTVSASKTGRQASNYAPGEVIVKLKPGASQLRSADQDERLMSVARLAGDTGGAASSRSAESLVRTAAMQRVSDIISGRGLDRVFVLKFDPSADVSSIVSELRALDAVEYAEPNYLIELGGVIPDDPSFYDQWSLVNLGAGIPWDPNNDGNVDFFPSTPNVDIKASEAWEITKGSPDVVVALTDTGVDITHPDLAANIYTNPGEIAGNGVDDDHNGFVDDVHGFNVADSNGDVGDAFGHGTQMAGVLAAEMNNNIGITGICQSKVMPVRFYKRTGPDPTQYSATVADAARSLLYSIAAGASIINASWTTKLTSDDTHSDEAKALEDAVNATNDAGALLVCIAGNEGYDLDYSQIYPSSYKLPNQIVVAASDFNDEIWHDGFNTFPIRSGYGPSTVDLAAPGVSVLTTRARGNCFLCTQSNDSRDWYTRADGTSISAALVSGVAALLKSKYPTDNGIVLKRRILAGAEVRANLGNYVIGGRRLSAIGALKANVTISTPALSEFTYKAKNGKLIVYGSGMQTGASIIVGKTVYHGKPRSDDGTALLAIVPKEAFPSGTAVPIKVRNPDGGESQALSLTR
ncbi:MAG TPA: S8 family serine peptidase [Blastocatellia bacterium]|nr:S8 family serine peptidase [Blastocatellia bacterium]